ncbi:protein-disulfide reductase DsbD [Halomonas almeriensis]|uniref:protein-disulfide reductase DsbD n=1 Tax=Halomonas almeriensis TaxID=308163 RepID=UPI0025B621B3|nr:protein-disulfide reductase DsbD [Halomonas almeriensis]MDN3552608.1 protein-disulfide reductase DsbD [Halomonas almeriensis]
MAQAALVLVLCGLATSAQAQQKDILPPDQAFTLKLSQSGDSLTVDWDIEAGYYLYRHRFSAATPEGEIPLDLPEGEAIEDEYFGRSEVYRHGLRMTTQPGDADTITLHWQGCADAGLCYPPQQRTFDLPLSEGASATDVSIIPTAKTDNSKTDASGSKDASNDPGAIISSDETLSSSSDPGVSQADDQQLATQLATGNWGWTLLVFFGLGLLLTFTPCVLPMIPILSSLIVGQRRSGENQRLAGFILSLAYVLPMAATYAVLGVTAAIAGANLQMLFQNVWFIGIFSAVFVLLALAMFGTFELELPRALRNRLDAGMSRQRGGRLKGVAVMGVLSALLVGPCMTAPLAGALLFIAESGNPWLGGAALLALGLGMGAPLILIGTVGSRLLPSPGTWMVRIRALFGFILLGMAIWFVARVIPDTIVLGLWGALGLGFTVSLRALARGDNASGVMSQIATAMAIVVGLWSALMLIGAAGGGHDPWRPLAVYAPTGDASTVAAPDSTTNQPLAFDEVEDLKALNARIAQAADRGQMTLVEFTAEWCISCEVIEQEVFTDPSVKTSLQDVQRLSIDVTEYDATDKALMQHFSVVGPPTLMWFGPDGQEQRSARIIGELDAESFLERFDQARQPASTNTGDSS